MIQFTMTLKKNRSNIFTTGLCNTFDGHDWRTLFFELDNPVSQSEINRLVDIYRENKLDLLIHKTGSNGMHFLSPTMIPKMQWKEIMIQLSDLNPKCPMTTLRVEPNKYPNESEIWYRSDCYYYANPYYNNTSMCFYLKRLWQSQFFGFQRGDIKLVRYPLPL
jgi:hypothetical protein